MNKPKKSGAGYAPEVHTSVNARAVAVDRLGSSQGGNEMDIIIRDQFIMELGRRSARAFCKNHHPWGMDVDDVTARIWDYYAAAESDIVCHPQHSPEREAAARTAIAYALNKCKDESKANRVRMQPYQVRNAYERGENIDKAREVLIAKALEFPQVHKEESEAPVVVTTALNSSSVDLQLRVWVDSADYWPMSSALTQAVYETLNAHNIEIPFNQMTVHVNNN